MWPEFVSYNFFFRLFIEFWLFHFFRDFNDFCSVMIINDNVNWKKCGAIFFFLWINWNGFSCEWPKREYFFSLIICDSRRKTATHVTRKCFIIEINWNFNLLIFFSSWINILLRMDFICTLLVCLCNRHSHIYLDFLDFLAIAYHYMLKIYQ